VSGAEGILLRSSAVGYWHREETAGPSESVEIVRELETSPPKPAVNWLNRNGPGRDDVRVRETVANTASSGVAGP
jgi:hypothetical protein